MANTERVNFGIRKNDQVEVIAGKEKSKSGKVIEVDRKTGRITIEQVNMVKRHVKPSQKYPQGGIIERELPVHYSNVQLMCSKCNRGVRHGHKFVAKTGKNAKAGEMMKIRVCKRCDSTLEAV